MDGQSETRGLAAPQVIAIGTQAGAIRDPRRPDILAHSLVEGSAMVGVARLGRDTVHALWERHDGGDEVLMLAEGRLSLILRDDNGDRVLTAGPGDAILIPRGVAHSFKIESDEIRLLFITPRSGNVGWDEDGTPVKRHP